MLRTTLCCFIGALWGCKSLRKPQEKIRWLLKGRQRRETAEKNDRNVKRGWRDEEGERRRGVMCVLCYLTAAETVKIWSHLVPKAMLWNTHLLSEDILDFKPNQFRQLTTSIEENITHFNYNRSTSKHISVLVFNSPACALFLFTFPILLISVLLRHMSKPFLLKPHFSTSAERVGVFLCFVSVFLSMFPHMTGL